MATDARALAGMSPTAASQAVVLGAVGDVFVNRADPRSVFDAVRPVFDEVDVLFGNCEGAYSDAPSPAPFDALIRLCAPTRMTDGIADAGFDVMAMANNHTVDGGYTGLFDTADELRRRGVAVCGAGPTLAEARRPAVVERRGIRIAFLAYATTFPVGYRAHGSVPGISTLRTHTVHETPEFYAPGTSARVLVFVDPEDLEQLRDAVESAAEQADFVVTSFHMGGGLGPVVVNGYEREIARVAIDSGASIVLGHHHHILRGVDFHRGRPIFHGLGHFVFDLPRGDDVDEGFLESMRERDPEYGIFYRPDYPLLPFHPESRMTVIALCRLQPDRTIDVGIVPCYIGPDGVPRPVDPAGTKGQQVLAYAQRITDAMGMRGRLSIGETFDIGGCRAVRVAGSPDMAPVVRTAS